MDVGLPLHAVRAQFPGMPLPECTLPPVEGESSARGMPSNQNRFHASAHGGIRERQRDVNREGYLGDMMTRELTGIWSARVPLHQKELVRHHVARYPIRHVLVVVSEKWSELGPIDVDRWPE